MAELLQDSKFFHESMIDNYKYCPLTPDEWSSDNGNYLHSPSEFDVEYFGEGTLRLPSGRYEGIEYPVKVYVTGSIPQRKRGDYRIRVKIEFLRDGEESQFSGGWIWLPVPGNLR